MNYCWECGNSMEEVDDGYFLCPECECEGRD